MKNWEKYEIEACDFLNDTIKISGVEFKSSGGTNSNEPDIKVFKNGLFLFSIEAKLSPSQGGQFVIIENLSGRFNISENNKYSNPYSHHITEFINKDFLLFISNPDKPKSIECDKYLLSEWVKQHYIHKGSKFIISSSNLNSGHCILPIEEFDSFFNVSAVVRRKRSGTRKISSKSYASMTNFLEKHLELIGVRDYYLEVDNKRCFLKLTSSFELEKAQRYFENFFISETQNSDTYEIKLRANTNNLNVIFSLELKQDFNAKGIDLLIESINTTH